MGYNEATKFISRIVFGCIIAIWIGPKIEEFIKVGPFITIGLLLYVIIGSMILLVKEISDGRKT